jgi:S1-C subfamily serine protease
LIDAQGKSSNQYAIEASTTGASGIGLPELQCPQRVIPDLIAGNEITRPWIGICGMTLNSTLADELGLRSARGFTLLTSSPATGRGRRTQASNFDVNGNPTSGGDLLRQWTQAMTGIENLSVHRSKNVGDVVT